MSTSPAITVLSDDQKLDGENFLQWKANMNILLGARGLRGYVDGKIPKPTQPPKADTPATPIYSTTPSIDEWDFRDQLALGHITMNCRVNASSLRVNTAGTAKEAWDSIQDEWGQSTDMRRSQALQALNQTIYTEGTDISEHIKLLRTRKVIVDNLTTPAMNDEAWRGVIIRSIPPTAKWLPVIPSLYALKSSADVISTLSAHALILDLHTKPANSPNTALAARTTDSCTNPNCKAKKRSTHTTQNCYWPGGGKEGQFPPNFGQRSKANATTTSNPPVNSTTANSVTTISTTSQPETFALLARIPNTPGRSGVMIDDDPVTCPSKALVTSSTAFLSFQKGEVPTFIDSGASDTMFVSRNSFTTYTPIKSRVGDSAKAVDGGFDIVGEGSVVQKYKVDRKEKTITYTKVLHTPTLNANLVSVSALDNAGITITFGQGQGVARKADGTVVLAGKNVNGMYVLDPVNTQQISSAAMKSTSHSASLEQWHRRFTHCSPLTIEEMDKHNLVDGLQISEVTLTGKCEDCILGRQTRRPFDSVTEKDIPPLELVAFDLWGPSRVRSIGGKVFLMVIVDAGTSCKFGAYLSDKSDNTTLEAFDNFRARAENVTGRKICRLRTDGAFDSATWKEYLQKQGISHEPTAPYSSSQNGLAERAIRTTIDDVRTLLRDSGLGHSYWAEAAAYSIATRNLIPSRRHPGRIPLESFTKKRQSVAHLRVFGAKCWAKIPTVHGVQVTGGSKLDHRSTECRLLGYAPGGGNYRVQDMSTKRVFVSRDVIFEGVPSRTSANVGEQIPMFDTMENDTFTDTNVRQPAGSDPDRHDHDLDHNQDPDRLDQDHHPENQTDQNIRDRPDEPRRSTRVPQPSKAGLQSMEYKQREVAGRSGGDDWATNRMNPKASAVIDSFPADQENFLACITDTKASHHIPRSYRHAMTTDPERWMIPMKIEMETLKNKHTWDLVKPPPGANIMGSMWIYDIKWDGEGNHI